ncbi:MAG: VOC family protein [Desulfobacterales bacterium]|jgi:predicted esterase/catechol 2,3-dioxygenase-like lactoylglutathione lyase family enzyme
MTPSDPLSGIHHITGVASSAVENRVFYEKVLGLRLVKQTVNFDDPYTYHLYYGDRSGSPGTVLTFFPWERLPKGKPGAGMVTAVGFRVPDASIDFWRRRLAARGISSREGGRFGETYLQFEDPHGLPVELIGTSHLLGADHWDDSPVDRAHAISGFHSATATLKAIDGESRLLEALLGMSLHKREGNRWRFVTGDRSAPGHFYDLVIDPGAPAGRPGGGTIHHIAFRSTDDRGQRRWQSILREAGIDATEIKDRKYFRSIYFHTPGRILFEVATDGPGFAVDEPPEHLGTSLQLPEQFAAIRTDIEVRLPALKPPPFRHVFKDAGGASDDGHTVVPLHGTGGGEHDLIGLARAVFPSSAIISPRGRVRENGLRRFFRRLAVNVFDEADVIHRAHELSDFLLEAAGRYDRHRERLTAFGYSNGANMAAAVMLLRSEIFHRAVLLRPMLPLIPEMLPDLTGKRILVLRGESDTVIPGESTLELEGLFRKAGADLAVRSLKAGHDITSQDAVEISRWLEGEAWPSDRDVTGLPV